MKSRIIWYCDASATYASAIKCIRSCGATCRCDRLLSRIGEVVCRTTSAGSAQLVTGRVLFVAAAAAYLHLSHLPSLYPCPYMAASVSTNFARSDDGDHAMIAKRNDLLVIVLGRPR